MVIIMTRLAALRHDLESIDEIIDLFGNIERWQGDKDLLADLKTIRHNIIKELSLCECGKKFLNDPRVECRAIFVYPK